MRAADGHGHVSGGDYWTGVSSTGVGGKLVVFFPLSLWLSSWLLVVVAVVVERTWSLLACRPIDWLVGWLVGWLAGWSVPGSRFPILSYLRFMGGGGVFFA